MIEIGLKYKVDYNGDIYEVVELDGNICRVRNNNHPDEEDRFKWVNCSGLAYWLKQHKYKKVD